MSKSVLISIHPKWCELIASGRKTIEVRKTKPQLQTPFKCYIYCTQGLFKDLRIIKQSTYSNRMKVIGEFICDWIRCETEIADGLIDEVLESTSCVSARELYEYANGSALYSWHISNLKIYDKPKGLNEFHIFKPQQSWCYVEEGENEND